MTTRRVPAHVQVYVDVLGSDRAVDFLLRFGGAEVYFSEDPKGGSEIEQAIGRADLVQLSERLPLKHEVPVAKSWIAAMLYEKGWTIAAIARKLHTTRVTVRKYVKTAGGAQPVASDQLNLPL